MSQNGTSKKRSVKHLKATGEVYFPDARITAESRRVPLSAMIAAGKLPDELMSMVETSKEGGEVSVSGDDMKGMFGFAIEMMKNNLTWPRVVDEADPESEDEIEPGHLGINDVSAYLTWIFTGCPTVPVKTTGGEVSAASVASFRQDAELQSAGADVGDVPRESGAAGGAS